jgi:uncharacterized protein
MKFARHLILLLFILAGVSRAEPVSQLQPTGYVNDFAHVLNQSTISEIDDICRQIDEKAHAQIALVTVNSLDGSDIESYAVNLFKKWGIGDKASNRGVLILYAIQDRRARIEVGYGLEPILPDGKVGSFQREAVPLMRAGDHNGALLLVTERVTDVITQDAGVQLTKSQPHAHTEQDNQPQPGLSLGTIAVLAIVFFIVMATPLRSIVFAILFSSLFGGGRGYGRGGGWSGGGFGGGGSFGGFGGGSSGGGGASSSW